MPDVADAGDEMLLDLELAIRHWRNSGDGSILAGVADRAEKVISKLVAEVRFLRTWDGLMFNLDRFYPEDVFPIAPDDPERDAGARIISLIRYLADAREGLSCKRCGNG